jgi:hypothetical protein
MGVYDTIDYKWLQSVCERLQTCRMNEYHFFENKYQRQKYYLVTLNFALGVILKVPISLESALNDFAELFRKRIVVEQVMYSKTRTGRFAGVSWTNTFLGGSDAATIVSKIRLKEMRKNTSIRLTLPL